METPIRTTTNPLYRWRCGDLVNIYRTCERAPCISSISTGPYNNHVVGGCRVLDESHSGILASTPYIPHFFTKIICVYEKKVVTLQT